jgi:hypothetical protein
MKGGVQKRRTSTIAMMSQPAPTASWYDEFWKMPRLRVRRPVSEGGSETSESNSKLT